MSWVPPFHPPPGWDARPPVSSARADFVPSLEHRLKGRGELHEFSEEQDYEGGTRPDSPEPGVRMMGERRAARAREAGPA